MLKGYSLWQDALRMVGSGSMVQAIALLIMPWVSMLYAPELLGVFALFSLVASILALISGGRYEQAIIVAKNISQARYLTILAILINGSVALLVALVGWLLKDYLFQTQYHSITPYILWIPVVVFLAGIYNSFCAFTVYRGQFDKLMTARLTQGLGNSAGKLLLAYPKASVADLILSFSLSHIAGFLALFIPRRSQKKEQSSPTQSAPFCWKELFQTAHQYRSFPLFSLPQAMIDTLLGSVLLLLMPYEYGVREIGLLTMAVTLSRRPIQLIADNIGLVYFNRFAECVRTQQRITPLVRKMVLYWIAVAVPLGIFFFFTMPFWVSLILNKEYALCTPIIQAIIPLLIPNFLNCILNVLPDVFRQQKKHLFVQILLFLAEISIIVLLLHLRLPFHHFVIGYYGLVMIVQWGYTIWLRNLIQSYEKSLADQHQR